MERDPEVVVALAVPVPVEVAAAAAPAGPSTPTRPRAAATSAFRANRRRGRFRGASGEVVVEVVCMASFLSLGATAIGLSKGRDVICLCDVALDEGQLMTEVVVGRLASPPEVKLAT
jgi:hypothetical protein